MLYLNCSVLVMLLTLNCGQPILRGPSRGLTRGSTRGQCQFGLGQIEDSVSGLTPV